MHCECGVSNFPAMASFKRRRAQRTRSRGSWPPGEVRSCAGRALGITDLKLVLGDEFGFLAACPQLEALALGDCCDWGDEGFADAHSHPARPGSPDGHGDADGFQLPHDDPVLYYLQRLRDESHRFVIGAHRQKRSKAITNNPLDEVPGIGAKRKRALLNHFGSARAVARAGLKDLERVNGISDTVARRIYDFFTTND